MIPSDLFFHIFTLSLTTFGISCLIDTGMLLGRLGDIIDKAQPRTRFWLKPLIICPTCMSSVYGTLYAYAFGFDVLHWLVLVFASAGLSYIISNK